MIRSPLCAFILVDLALGYSNEGVKIGQSTEIELIVHYNSTLQQYKST